MFAWRNKREADLDVYLHFAGKPVISGTDFMFLNWGINPFCERLAGPDIGEIAEAEKYVFAETKIDSSRKLKATDWLAICVDAGIPVNRHWVNVFTRQAQEVVVDLQDSVSAQFRYTSQEKEEAISIHKLLSSPKLIWRHSAVDQAPDESASANQEASGSSTVSNWAPDYADDPRWPEELGIAMIAWRAACNNAEKESKRPGAYIREWLAAHYPKLSEEARKRIATVANWDKSPGAGAAKKE